MRIHQQRHLHLSTPAPRAVSHATVTPPCLCPPLPWLYWGRFSASPSSPTCDTFGALGLLLKEELVKVLKTNQAPQSHPGFLLRTRLQASAPAHTAS